MTRHETQRRANVLRGVHRLAEAATEAYAEARRTAGRYLNARSADEVIFTSGTTAGINLVAHAFGGGLAEGDEVVISLLEHHSNVVPWQMLRERKGIVLKVLPVTDDGRLDFSRLDSVVTERCRLIALTLASNVTGALSDVAPIVEAARGAGARVLLDAAQRAPHGALDVQALEIDFAFAPSRDIRCSAPTGSACCGGGPNCSPICHHFSAAAK